MKLDVTLDAPHWPDVFRYSVRFGVVQRAGFTPAQLRSVYTTALRAMFHFVFPDDQIRVTFRAGEAGPPTISRGGTSFPLTTKTHLIFELVAVCWGASVYEMARLLLLANHELGP